VIQKATPTATLAVTNSPVVYNASPQAATVSISASSVTGTVANVEYNGSGTVPTNAATYAVTADFVPTDSTNYNTLPGLSAGNFVIQKATPTITWSNPAAITYGTALGGTQLNATASVAGTFVYTPPSGTVLDAGAGQNLHVDFTPTDTTNHNNASRDVTINVLKATPTVNWTNPANIVYGTALSGTQLNATFTWIVNGSSVTVAGTPTYTPPSGTILLPGAGQTLHVAFAPTDTTNYNNASKDVTINVTYDTCTGPNPGGVILPPINTDGSSVFKVGSTVPVKFTVCDASGNPISLRDAVFGTNNNGTIHMINTVRGTVSNVNEEVVNDVPDVQFRYSDGKWIFNMATGNLTKNTTYYYQIPLADGSYVLFHFGTK